MDYRSNQQKPFQWRSTVLKYFHEVLDSRKFDFASLKMKKISYQFVEFFQPIVSYDIPRVNGVQSESDDIYENYEIKLLVIKTSAALASNEKADRYVNHHRCEYYSAEKYPAIETDGNFLTFREASN